MTAALVQEHSSAVGNVQAYSSPNTLGNVGVVVLQWQEVAFADVTNVTDTAGNTWTRATATNSAGLFNESIWYCLSLLGAANTVTASYAPGAQLFSSIRVLEYSGINAVDQVVSTTGNSVLTSTNFTPAAAHECCVLSVISQSGGFPTTPASYVSRTTGNQAPTTDDRVDCPAGPQNPQSNVGAIVCCCFCNPVAQPWATIAVLFKNVAGAAASYGWTGDDPPSRRRAPPRLSDEGGPGPLVRSFGGLGEDLLPRRPRPRPLLEDGPSSPAARSSGTFAEDVFARAPLRRVLLEDVPRPPSLGALGDEPASFRPRRRPPALLEDTPAPRLLLPSLGAFVDELLALRARRPPALLEDQAPLTRLLVVSIGWAQDEPRWFLRRAGALEDSAVLPPLHPFPPPPIIPPPADANTGGGGQVKYRQYEGWDPVVTTAMSDLLRKVEEAAAYRARVAQEQEQAQALARDAQRRKLEKDIEAIRAELAKIQPKKAGVSLFKMGANVSALLQLLDAAIDKLAKFR
jgi:hypothetical protein